MKITIHENTDDLASVFSAETIESIGRGMDEVDVHDRSRQYTFDEMIDAMIAEGIYDPAYRSTGI